jgi:hypothetical protein
VFIGTICAANHLPKAACLARSLERTQGRHTFALCLIERDLSTVGSLGFSFPVVIGAAQIGIPHFDNFIFRHNVYEACTAIKAQFLLWALQQYPEERHFLLLDPDMVAYSRFEEVETMFGRNSTFPKHEIIVTPHQIQDETSSDGIPENTCRVLVAGTFNLGFLGIHRSHSSVEFLLWWNRKLQTLCYMDWRTRGLFVDQKWVLLGISFFDMSVLREPGYNVANWNISKRSVSINPKTHQYLVNRRPLRLFHFSGIDCDHDLYFFRQVLDPSSPVFAMRNDYKQQLIALGDTDCRHLPWSYGRFESGEPIGRDARLAYRNNHRLHELLSNPFDESNARLLSEPAMH